MYYNVIEYNLNVYPSIQCIVVFSPYFGGWGGLVFRGPPTKWNLDVRLKWLIVCCLIGLLMSAWVLRSSGCTVVYCVCLALSLYQLSVLLVMLGL